METVYYTLSARETIVTGDCVASAAGEPERRLVCVRTPASPAPPARDNVIDLAQWKQAREARTAPEELEPQAADAAVPPRRPLQPSLRRILLAIGEAAATLSVILTMVLLMLRIAAV